jgi:LPXTG-motif cell wall-anchored protein
MHRLLRLLVIAAGMYCLLCGLSFQLGAVPAHAQGQPPPRPTLTPAAPTPAHTAPVRHSDGSSPTAVPAGRITGTVIDQTTGAPAPNIVVAVGDQTVVTDANGNYDRSGLPAGEYVVALALAPEQGVAGQQPIAITLASGATTVQHLVFRSAVRAAPTPVAAVAPTNLPLTGGADQDGLFAIGLGAALIGIGCMLRSRKARSS